MAQPSARRQTASPHEAGQEQNGARVRTRATGLYPFVPSGADFELALAFFAELGFDKTWEHDGLAGLRWGGAYFMLQSIDVPEWQKNQMITIEVEDLDAYWAELEPRGLPARFTGVRLKPPTDFPWGREIHIIDPAGVCWYVRQSAKPAV
jgi:predicted enzyme related to lactoylglutathione lyase